jgi:carbonic anhydrase
MLAMSALAAGGKDYGYKQNGADWGPEINTAYATCVNGKEQSPIDLTESIDTVKISEKMEIIGYNYYNFPLNNALDPDSDPAWTTGITDDIKRRKAELNITFKDGSKEYFTPKQFHLHAPSEHSVNGKLYDAEVHLVHVYKASIDAPETYGAVIGIFFDMEEGGKEENAFLKSLWDSSDSFKERDPSEPALVNDVKFSEFLASVNMKEYWSYDGSFTTPPCTEGIKWSVIKQVQSISEKQLESITDYLAGDKDFAEEKGNNRVVQ